MVVIRRVSAPYALTVGGNSAVMEYLGLTPGFVGLYQANFIVPAIAPCAHYRWCPQQRRVDRGGWLRARFVESRRRPVHARVSCSAFVNYLKAKSSGTQQA